MIAIFCGISVVVYLFMAIIWSSEGLTNVLFKLMFAVLCLYALLSMLWSTGVLVLI